ncbi:ferritin family protein [Clostridium sp. D2Q-11]|uniref:Ferritin family protein n=1 Tax=Anaeromonas frigoriresistens TaxID=2683708 RepID=A0A942Z759_9FIRM|nr:ferritin family protein [Anaeromonas frigoriresistens]MBS4539211.1 ferritin family protein [Anaeromonas frigoriresistens]
MDIYEVAMKMELEGEEYYKKQMDMAESEGIKSIFKMMADDERKHYEIIKNIKENYLDCDSDIEIEEVDTIFTQRLENNNYFTDEVDEKDFRFGKINIDDTVKAYRHALKLEQESIDYYKKQVENAKSECDKKIFERLAKEEKKHYEAIDNILDHVTKSERWLEDARFNHIEDY